MMNNHTSDDMSWLRDYVEAVHVTYCDEKTALYRSQCASLDVNDHIREVCEHVTANNLPRGKTIDIFYKGKRMFAGDGPAISKNSIAMIHGIDADIGQDIYCMCNQPDAQQSGST